jgi:hypothetical protein
MEVQIMIKRKLFAYLKDNGWSIKKRMEAKQ